MDTLQGTAQSRGFQITYEQTGSGPTIVVVPGWLQDATDWRSAGPPSIPAARYVDRLASSYRVIVVDPLGHGRSDKPHDWQAYQLPELAMDFIAPLDAAHVASAVFWGYSRGAYLAAVVAAEFPERVTALVVGGNPLTHEGWSQEWRGAMGDGWDRSWSLNPWPFPIDRSWAEDNDHLALAAQMDGETRSLRSQTDGGTRSAVGYRLDLDRITSPRLLYCGGNDSPETMRSTADRLGVELHVLDGLDHIQTFREVDGVLGFVLAFVTEHAQNQSREHPTIHVSRR